MKETLHILKKDLRRYWPENLISLILLGYFAKYALRDASDYSAAVSVGLALSRATLEMTRPFLVLFWVFLTLRVVQSENLVGDRQWWVTKPYEWWKLLLAKELFLLLVVSVPLFLVQGFLLHQAGFPVVPNLRGLLSLQLGLAIFLFLPSLTLGSLTKNVGQALLGAGLVFLAVTGGSALLSQIPSSSMSSAAEGTATLQGLLLFGSVIGAAGWQYARRRTWASRGVVLSAAAAITLVGAATPYGTFVERKYPLVEGGLAPAQFAGQPVPRKKETESRSANGQSFDLRSATRDVNLRLPLSVSGIAPGKVVQVEGLKTTIETPEGVLTDRGWGAQSADLWADDSQRDFWFAMTRQEFDRMKSQAVRLHVEMALAEYQESEGRELVLQEGQFTEPELGICQLKRAYPQIDCRRPFRQPALMATFDPAESKCAAEETEETKEQTPEDKISHAWFPPQSSSGPELGLNPVQDYPVTFVSRTWFSGVGPGRKPRMVHLCPGAKVRLAKPEWKRNVRVKVEISDVRVLDLLPREGFDE